MVATHNLKLANLARYAYLLVIFNYKRQKVNPSCLKLFRDQVNLIRFPGAL